MKVMRPEQQMQLLEEVLDWQHIVQEFRTHASESNRKHEKSKEKKTAKDRNPASDSQNQPPHDTANGDRLENSFSESQTPTGSHTSLQSAAALS